MDVSPQDIFQFTLPPPSSTLLPSESNDGPSPRRKFNSTRTSSVKGRQSQRKSVHFEDDFNNELEKYTIKALRGESLAKCDINLFPHILSSLEEQRLSYTNSNMHDEVQNVYKAIKHTEKSQKEAKLRLIQKKMKQDLINRKQDALNELGTLDDKAKGIELNMILAFKNQVTRLEKKQKKEIENFDNQWTSIDKQRMYNKTSDELKNLRRQEDLYLEQKLYQDSVSAKKRADKIEKVEIQNAIQQMSFDYQTALVPIKLQHEQEMKTLLKAQEDEERIFENTKKSEMNTILARIKKIDIELENLNDLAYIERLQQRSRAVDSQTQNSNNIDFSQSVKNSLSLGDQKRIAVNEFNMLTVAPLKFTKKTKTPSSRRSLIRSPRSNSNRTQRTIK